MAGLYLVVSLTVILIGLCVTVDIVRRGAKGNQLTQRVKSITGLMAVLAGDAAIAGSALWGVHKTGGTKEPQWAVSILTASFTAIVSITTAYFGIKAVTNMAHDVVLGQTPPSQQNDEQ
ncbi:hypothetical protein [Streptomyces sp. NPDC021608]